MVRCLTLATRGLMLLLLVAPLILAGFGAARSEDAAAPPATREQIEADWLRQDAVRDDAPATPQEDAVGACDGVKNGKWGFHTALENDPWWQIDLGESLPLERIVIYNRCDHTAGRAARLAVLLSENGGEFQQRYQHDGSVFLGQPDGKPLIVRLDGNPARYVRLQVPGNNCLHLDEVEIYRTGESRNVALGRPATQSSVCEWSTRKGAARSVSYPTAKIVQQGLRLAASLRGLEDAEISEQGFSRGRPFRAVVTAWKGRPTWFHSPPRHFPRCRDPGTGPGGCRATRGGRARDAAARAVPPSPLGGAPTGLGEPAAGFRRPGAGPRRTGDVVAHVGSVPGLVVAAGRRSVRPARFQDGPAAVAVSDGGLPAGQCPAARCVLRRPEGPVRLVQALSRPARLAGQAGQVAAAGGFLLSPVRGERRRHGPAAVDVRQVQRLRRPLLAQRRDRLLLDAPRPGDPVQSGHGGGHPGGSGAAGVLRPLRRRTRAAVRGVHAARDGRRRSATCGRSPPSRCSSGRPAWTTRDASSIPAGTTSTATARTTWGSGRRCRTVRASRRSTATTRGTRSASSRPARSPARGG